MAITALPVPPSRSDPVNFSERADAFLLALPTFTEEANALQVDVNNKQVAAANSATASANSATASANSATEAAASAASAALTTGVTAWASGTNYTVGQVRYDTSNFLTYRCKQAVTGSPANTYLPSSANGQTYWQLLGGDVTTNTTQVLTGTKTFNDLRIGTATGYVNLSYSNASPTTITIPYVGSTADIVLTAGNQTIAGEKTFSSNLSILNGTTQMNFALGSSGGYFYGTATTVGWFKSGGGSVSWSASTGNLTSSGNISAYSDERLKTDWENLPADFIDKIAKVKSGTFNRLDIEARQAGVGAQSLRSVLGEVVHEDVAGMLSVSYGNAAMVTCIELAKEVVLLRERLARLEQSVAGVV